MIASEDILKRKYLTFGADPIMMALNEHLNIERAMGEKQVYDSDRVVLLYNNGVKRPRNQALWQWCKEHDRPAYCIERASLPNMSMIDPNGMLADSCSYDGKRWNHPLTDEQRHAAKEYINAHTMSDVSLEKQCSGRMTRDEFMGRVGKGWEQIVFVPLQKELDTTVIMWSRWVNDVAGFTQVVYDVARHWPKTLFLVKPHPLSRVKDLPETENVKLATPFHYKDCIANCDKVYVINSGAGMQACMWLKPTYVFGKSHYLFTGISKSVDDIDQARSMVDDHFIVNREKVLRFLYHLKHVLWSDVDLSHGAKQCRYQTIRMIDK